MLGSPLRSWSLLSLLLGLTAVAAHAGPPRGTGTIVVGVTGIDSPETRLLLLDTTPGTSTAPVEGGTVVHLAGHAPMGVVVDDQHVALVVRAGSRDDGLLLLRDLGTGTESPLLDGVMATHAPLRRQRADRSLELVAVRHSPEELGGARFDVVAVDVKTGTGQVLASAPRLWLTPVRGAAADVAFLVIDGGPGFQPNSTTNTNTNTDGQAHIDVVKDGILTPRWTLGPGTFRSPVCTASRCVIEQEQNAHAVLLDEQGHTLLKGRPGLQPVATATTLTVSSSHKDGSVLVAVGDAPFTRWTSGRAGVARPLALVETAGDTVVVAWLDRGPMQPGELWAIAKGRARRLMAPVERTAVTVYGVLPPGEGSR